MPGGFILEDDMKKLYNLIPIEKVDFIKFLEEYNIKLDIYTNFDELQSENTRYTVSIELENWNTGADELKYFYIHGFGHSAEEATMDLIKRRNEKNFHINFKDRVNSGRKTLLPFFKNLSDVPGKSFYEQLEVE